MKKYFKEEREEEILLSEYLRKDTTYFMDSTYSEDSRTARTEYIMEILGDVLMSYEVYDLFIREFSFYGGRYDVRTTPDTIKGIYEITRKYPKLSINAIDMIWHTYIKDLFDEYDLLAVYDKYIEIHGEEDETFELYIEYVNEKAREQQERYIEDSLRVDELYDEYGEQFTKFIKYIIKRKHYTYDDIKKYLPDSELIKKDEQHITDISSRTRIFFGCCEPVSYTMLETLVKEKTLDTFTETPTYYISTGRKEQATFTKQEFLDSIKKVVVKKLEK